VTTEDARNRRADDEFVCAPGWLPNGLVPMRATRPPIG
jgi:hypothetical protein